jgi:ABC-type branched-subunit amino acid transport system substrate-binding protein
LRNKKRAGLVGAVVCVGLALSACSDDGSSGDSTESSASGGDPIKIMTVAPVGTSAGGANLPESVAAVSAAVRALNERGGLGGRQVELVHCNDRNDATAAADCGQQAVDEGVVAVVGMYSQTGGVLPALESAGIPSIGSVGISGDGSELTSKNSFVYYDNLMGFVACPTVLSESGANQIGSISYDIAASARVAQLVLAGGVAAGKPINPEIKLPPATSDYAPVAAQLRSAGATAVTLVSPEASSVALMQAAGPSVSYCNAQGALSEASLTSVGPAAQNFYESGPFPPLSAADQYPELQQFNTEMDAAEASGDAEAAVAKRKATSINAWLSVQVLEKVAKEISGSITGQSLLDQLNKTTNLDIGLVPPMNFTQPTPIPGLERMFNTAVRANKWDAASRQLVPASDTIYNGLELLANAQGR